MFLLEGLACALIHARVYGDRMRVVGAARDDVIHREQRCAEHDEMQQWLAHPGG